MTESTTFITTPSAREATELDRLWRDFSRDLRGFIARRVATPEDAEDILQIVFLRMAKGLDNLRDRDRVLGWMYSITRNAITDYYRAAPHRHELAVDTLPDNPSDTDSDPDLGDDVQRELSACLQPMLSGLPTDQADAVRMVDLEAQTHVTAATSAGISVSGMKSRVQRGRAALRQRLVACCQVSQDPRGHVHDYQPRSGSCDC
ncbi:sigma-70 family RNA polymerase sigma factor, partial [Aldersonia kunmingensis]|uniref:sigma-70 family RNA polymerase sigma factor n=1 Tax=Aldersonia kunmingensis TaxID=408066 RepID=UPI0008325A34